jgi:hypothetical protein
MYSEDEILNNAIKETIDSYKKAHKNHMEFIEFLEAKRKEVSSDPEPNLLVEERKPYFLT